MMLPFIQAAHALENRLERALETVGLSIAKYGVLALLVEAEGPMPLSELAARQSCVRSNMTQLIDRMEAEGMVQRVPDPTDRRIVRAGITERGRALAAAGAEQWDEVQAAFSGSVSHEEDTVLRQILSKIT